MARVYLAVICLLFSMAANALRDPTMPQGGLFVGSDASATQGPKLAASLVLVSDNRKLALINGRTLGVGEEFEGGKILEINENGVEVLQADGEIVFLPVQASQKNAQWKFIKVYRDE